MSLKNAYLDGASGFTQQMQGVFEAGQQFVVDNSAALENALQLAASKGQKKFTVKLMVSFEPVNLRLNGIHQQTFFNGIMAQLALESIYDYEVTLSLNTSDQTDTGIDFNFTF